MPKTKQAAPWCPDECPITGRKFFMWIERADGIQVPTYGGPYDSFTLAERDEQGTFWCERFDQDEGVWSDSIHIDLRLINNQREDFEFGHVDQLESVIQALRPDAQRYRWLRDPDGQEDLGSEYNMPPIICGYAEHEDILANAALDRAIDQGMEALKS
ncbi:hypothetical protein [Pseudomonas asiatica]|uniref:hypothetical protein n=1 Tax=Pseudomonas asiatica TaxID=2219225 RepID=UPI000C246338|nr:MULTISPECIES: hypothetical protein [Pseudomonas]CAB5622229.1 Uncharacterised protein [Pseudomonas putida]PJI71473.1 hypothetical protein CSW00_23790 [Pseudomonas sp. MR 02]CAB5648123.1 Uncharacterised protein [Pseudomonas putida]CAB5692674.1 Uncharacterised protein [Pseudomonas putida]CAC9676077.1 Uncharacterised protein [Pseudomonas putida]